MRKKILVVDDDPEVVELLSFNLQKAGFAIGRAANGVEALKKIGSISPDLIVLDLMMPDMTGFDVVQQLRADPQTQDIPILVFTAKDVTEEDRQHLKDHVRAIVSKTGKDDLLRELEKSAR